jgi:hypothetical protein
MHFHSYDDFVDHELAAVLSTQPITLPAHCLTTDVKRLAQDRLFRVYKFFPLPHDPFERFACPTGQVTKIAFCATGIATQLLARLSSGLWGQQQRRHST